MHNEASTLFRFSQRKTEVGNRTPNANKQPKHPYNQQNVHNLIENYCRSNLNRLFRLYFCTNYQSIPIAVSFKALFTSLTSILVLGSFTFIAYQCTTVEDGGDSALVTTEDTALVSADTVMPEPPKPQRKDGPLIEAITSENAWVDSVFNTLSEDDKIAQLFTVAIYPYKDSNGPKIETLLEKHAIGGIIVMKGGPITAVNLINKYQGMSRVPLLVSTDAEWGVKMRMDSVSRLPYELSIGAVQDNSLVYRMGVAIAKQHQRMGMHVNFAPVVDINNNPNNPVIGMRSFGEHKHNVADKGWAYAKGMQDNGILAIAKHFPGHGDTDVDSHFDLPVISHDMERLESVELYPFQSLIDSGLGGLMTTHLFVPALDTTKNLAAGLSKPTVTGMLKEKMGFKGLIYTDALNMDGITKHFPNGQIDVLALQAGNDVLLMSEDVNVSLAAVKKALGNGELSWDEIDLKVKKQLAVKFWAGLNNYTPISTKGLIADLNGSEVATLNQELANGAITRLRNTNNVLPLLKTEQKVAVVTLGSSSSTTFRSELNSEGVDFSHFHVGKNSSTTSGKAMGAKVSTYDVVLVAVHANGFRPKGNYGVSDGMLAAIKELANHPNAVLVVFADAYSLGKMGDLTGYTGIVCGYQNTAFVQRAAAAAVVGKLEPTGIFPVTVNDAIVEGMME